MESYVETRRKGVVTIEVDGEEIYRKRGEKETFAEGMDMEKVRAARKAARKAARGVTVADHENQ
jgi:hypothetical protein